MSWLPRMRQRQCCPLARRTAASAPGAPVGGPPAKDWLQVLTGRQQRGAPARFRPAPLARSGPARTGRIRNLAARADRAGKARPTWVDPADVAAQPLQVAVAHLPEAAAAHLPEAVAAHLTGAAVAQPGRRNRAGAPGRVVPAMSRDPTARQVRGPGAAPGRAPAPADPGVQRRTALVTAPGHRPECPAEPCPGWRRDRAGSCGRASSHRSPGSHGHRGVACASPAQPGSNRGRHRAPGRFARAGGRRARAGRFRQRAGPRHGCLGPLRSGRGESGRPRAPAGRTHRCPGGRPPAGHGCGRARTDRATGLRHGAGQSRGSGHRCLAQVPAAPLATGRRPALDRHAAHPAGPTAEFDAPRGQVAGLHPHRATGDCQPGRPAGHARPDRLRSARPAARSVRGIRSASSRHRPRYRACHRVPGDHPASSAPLPPRRKPCETERTAARPSGCARTPPLLVKGPMRAGAPQPALHDRPRPRRRPRTARARSLLY
jgi:hypothetical protein